MDFRHEPHPDYLLVTATGPFDAQACRAEIGEVLRICSERKLAKILVDARAIGEVISIADRFELANVAATAKVPRIAILVSRANAEHSRAFENTAINRGASVRTTASEEEARQFLGIAP